MADERHAQIPTPWEDSGGVMPDAAHRQQPMPMGTPNGASSAGTNVSPRQGFPYRNAPYPSPLPRREGQPYSPAPQQPAPPPLPGYGWQGGGYRPAPWGMPPQAPFGWPYPSAGPLPDEKPPVDPAPDEEEAGKGEGTLGKIRGRLPQLAITGLALAIVALLASFLPSYGVLAIIIAFSAMILSAVPLVCALLDDSINKEIKDRWVPIAGLAGATLAIIIAFVVQALAPAPGSNVEYYERTGSASSEAIASYGSSSSSLSASSAASSVAATDSTSSSASSSASATGAATLTGTVESTEGWVAEGSFTDLAIGTTIEFAPDFAVCVNAVEGGLINYDGNVITCITVTYSNASSLQKSYYEYDWKAQTAEGIQVQPCYYTGTTDELGSGKIEPGATVTGNIYFEGTLAKVLFTNSQLGNNQASWIVA